RPLGHARLHRTRLLGCALVLSSWMIVPPLVHWGIGALQGLAQFGRMGQIADVWACTSVAWSACAMALFAASLPCGPWLRLGTCATALLAVFTVADSVAATPAGIHSAAAFAAAHLAAAALFGAASFANAFAVADPDRPWPRPARWCAAAIIAVVVAVAADAAFALP